MKLGSYFLILLSLFAISFSSYKLFMVYLHPIKYEDEIIFYANEYTLSPKIIASVINVESGFDKNAKSNKDAIGLMQIKLNTANYLNQINNEEFITEKDLFTPTINIKYGCMYLQYLFNKFKDTNTVFAAYNAGETRVKTWLNNKDYSSDKITLNYIPYKETRNYVKKVNNNIKYYKKIYNN